MDKISKFCARVKDSHPDAEFIYTNGACWEFFLMLRVFYPNATPYYDHEMGHVYTEIDGKFYDINGTRLKKHDGLEKIDRKISSDAHRWKRRKFNYE